jgi:hypothetical protein
LGIRRFKNLERISLEEKKLAHGSSVLRTNSHSEGLIINQYILGLLIDHQLRYSVRTDALVMMPHTVLVCTVSVQMIVARHCAIISHQ